jgi:hypothetical protein
MRRRGGRNVSRHTLGRRQQHADEVAGHLAECTFFALRYEKQSPASRRAAALAYARKAMEAYEQAAKDQQNVVGTINLAWFLVAGPVQELEDAHRAERLMREVTGRSSPPQSFWAALGAAKYYCDDLPGAAAALEAEHRLHPEQFGFWDFYVAMIHARPGRKREARACFDRAESWMNVNGMQRKHERIRRESAAVLGLDRLSTVLDGTRAAHVLSGARQLRIVLRLSLGDLGRRVKAQPARPRRCLANRSSSQSDAARTCKIASAPSGSFQNISVPLTR